MKTKDQGEKQNKEKIVYNKKEGVYNDLKIDELLEKNFKDFNKKYFNK